MSKQVTVIGAGFAGLACARRLAHAGVGVTVLEARDRVGGRVWSQKLENGGVIERGAELVMENYMVMPALAEEFGLELASNRTPFADREVAEAGAPSRAALIEAARRLAEHFEQLLASGEGPVSVATAIGSSPLADAEKRVILARLTGTITTDLSNVDLAWVGATAAHDGSVGFDMPRYVVGGNQQIASKIAEELGERIELGSPVSSLDQTGDQVRATLESGRTVTSDATVLAVPPPIMRQLSFAPALPAIQAKAYDRVGFGVASKLGVAVAEPVAPIVIQEVPAPFSIYVSARPDGSDPDSFSAFAGSPGAQRSLGLGTGDPSAWLERLGHLGREFRIVGEPVLTEWINERWTGGSYSFRPLGWSSELEQALRAPFGKIVFAGEHTAPMEVSASMEGALRSGQRAADEVIELLQRESVAAPLAG